MKWVPNVRRCQVCGMRTQPGEMKCRGCGSFVSLLWPPPGDPRASHQRMLVVRAECAVCHSYDVDERGNCYACLAERNRASDAADELDEEKFLRGQLGRHFDEKGEG
jgi:hypothetical protein